MRENKELEKILPLSMPTTAGLQKFQFTLCDKVAACALDKTQEQIIRWLGRAFTLEYPYKKLAKVKSIWEGVNRKLIVALSPLLTGAFERSITEEEQ